MSDIINCFAIIGIIWVSSKVVLESARLIDKINLWGTKKGYGGG